MTAPISQRLANNAAATGRRAVKVLAGFRPRLILVTLVAVAALGVGVGLAFARSSAPSIGTGVVVINTKLGYGGGAAAGTGIVLTSSGEVLTNNHVIRGATSIQIVVPGTTHRYSAKVLGYNLSADVALLQLSSASNLKTVSIGDSSKVTTGQSVKAVGNANGTGTLASATGTVTGLRKTITVSDDQGGSARLAGLIETDAGLEPGDSGGPLLNSAGQVIGMDAAASTGFTFEAARASDSYAIPVNKTLTIVKQIESGKASAALHIGPTAFLGIQVAGTTGGGFGGSGPAGAVIAGTVSGGPADSAGLTAGDVITAINGRTVSSPSTISSLILAKKPGAKITITYTDASGTSQVTTVTLGSGPPQ